MLRYRYSTVWGGSVDVGMHGSSGNCCTRLRQWCALHIMRRRHIPALVRGSRRGRDGAWIQFQQPTPTCAIEYVTSQNGPGWAIALHSAMPY
jgi:hypothetical protein